MSAVDKLIDRLLEQAETIRSQARTIEEATADQMKIGSRNLDLLREVQNLEAKAANAMRELETIRADLKQAHHSRQTLLEILQRIQRENAAANDPLLELYKTADRARALVQKTSGKTRLSKDDRGKLVQAGLDLNSALQNAEPHVDLIPF